MTLPLNQICFLTLPNTSSPNFVLDTMPWGDKTGVTLAFYTGGKTQQWLIEAADPGTFYIVNQEKSWVMDGNASGEVWVSEKSAAASQVWFFDGLDNGSFGIRNKASGLNLWGSPESMQVQVNIFVASANTWNQWTPQTQLAHAVPANSPCVLANYSNPNQAIKVLQEQNTSGLGLASYNGSNTEYWEFKDAGQSFFYITNPSSGRVLDGDPQGNIRVNMQNAPGTDSAGYQQWFFYDWKNGFYKIRNRATGLFISADAAGKVGALAINGNNNDQLWVYDQGRIQIDLNALGKLFPSGWNKTIDGGHPCAEYTSSDSKFRSKQPSWTPSANGGGTAVMQLDHIRGGDLEKDDHATITVNFLPTGQVYNASLEWSLGSSWAIEWGTKVIVEIEGVIDDKASSEAGDAAVEIADLLSAGALAPLDPLISKAASAMTSKLISSLFSNLNGMLKKELGHDDGGRQTFIAVVTHNMNKLSNSMAITPALNLPNTSISFDTAAFPGALYNNLLAAYGSKIEPSPIQWDGDHTTYYNVKEIYLDELVYTTVRTWKPDCSAFPFKQGLYISTKIDLKHGSAAKDGHFVVMIGVSSNGKLNTAQASLEYPPPYNISSYLSPLFIGLDADSQLEQDLLANKPMNGGPDAVKQNILAMLQCIRTSA